MDTVQLVVVAEVTVGVVLCGPRDKHVDVAARGGEARGEAAEGNQFTVSVRVRCKVLPME